ncbi:hypothetical protein D9V28_04920 [Mycetocola zhadangensis]|uniref:Uncharacterized protein n=2 Tax=Mycetocola zhadangensis TaxID=1164595 RepID=A0A3L7J6M1_9MICO|nr:hypothetical protein D9V28_04920 [Mycetocola zhadangensis]
MVGIVRVDMVNAVQPERDDGHDDADDVQSPEVTEQQGVALLQLSFQRLDTLTGRADQARVAPTTSLAGDDRATPYAPLSSQVNSAIAVATDHLMGLRVAIEDSNWKIMTFAWWTLIRSAYESCGNALWLMSPRQRDTRVLRSLQITHDSRRSVNKVMLELGRDDPGFDRMNARMIELRDARPGNFGKSLKPDFLTSRLREISPLVPNAFETPVALWMLSSGMAHGNSAMFLNLLERKRLTLPVNGTSEHRLTTSVGVLAMFYTAALDMIEVALELFDERNCPLIGQKTPTWVEWSHLALAPEIAGLLDLPEHPVRLLRRAESNGA